MCDGANLEERLVSQYEHERKPLTRARLLATMVKVAARSGYRRAAVEDVIAGAGVARSTFYEHFTSRRECFLAALKAVGEEFVRRVEAAAKKAETRIEPVFDAIVDFGRWSAEGAKVLFAESLAAGPKSLKIRQGLIARVGTMLARTQDARSEEGGITATALSRGVFRLLAVRWTREAVNPPDLAADLATWARCYPTDSRTPGPTLMSDVRVTALAPESLPSLAGGHLGDGASGQADARRAQRLRIIGALEAGTYECGYESVTVGGLAARAGVSRKAFYRQFSSKEQAAMEATDRFFQAAMTACAGAFFSAEWWPERAWRGGHALLSFLAAHPEAAYLAFVESAAIGDAALRQAYDRAQAFTLFLEEGFRMRDEAAVLPRLISEVLMATMYEWGFDELIDRRSAAGLPATLPELSYLIIAPFIGEDAARSFVAEKLEESRDR